MEGNLERVKMNMSRGISARLELQVHPRPTFRGLDSIPVPLSLDRLRVLAHAEERVADVRASPRVYTAWQHAQPHELDRYIVIYVRVLRTSDLRR